MSARSSGGTGQTLCRFRPRTIFQRDFHLFADAGDRGRPGTFVVRERAVVVVVPLSRRGRLQLLDTVRAAGRRLSHVQLSARAAGRQRHRRAAHHRRRAARTAAQDVVPARSAVNAARALSHARQHKR